MDIERIEEVLPLIEGRTDFVTKWGDGYIAIDYVISTPDTFEDRRREELRGIKFHMDGRVMARPLHKFFNLGEGNREIPSGPFVIMEKLDGSMIHAALVDDRVVFMTRMGLTDVAQKATRHMTAALRAECRGLLLTGFTPIFEFTAPDNRIVIRYERSQLTLLAIRNNLTGEYLRRDGLEVFAGLMGVDLVKTWEPTDLSVLMEQVRGLKGAEGVVLWFENGEWLKLKGEEYVLMHKAKDQITLEKNVLAIILDGSLDDLKPLLSPEDKAKIAVYEDGLWKAVHAACLRIEALVDTGAYLDQKTFAVEHLKGLAPWEKALAFEVRGGKSAREAVCRFLRRHCGSQTKVDEVRAMIHFEPLEPPYV